MFLLSTVCSHFSVLCAVPGQATSSVDSTTPTAISLSWSIPSGSVVTEYFVIWQRNTSAGCADVDNGGIITITGSSTSHTVTGLEPGNQYTMTVTASNDAWNSSVSNAVTAMTEEAGKVLLCLLLLHSYNFHPQLPVVDLPQSQSARSLAPV